MIVCWWSGGITSAVACKIAIGTLQAVPVFIETGSHHPDTVRFRADCERWYDKEIKVIQSPTYTDHFDVIEKTRYINGPTGARCTASLKRYIREKWEKENKVEGHVWGFEYGKKEEDRAYRIKLSIPNVTHYFPLIEAQIDKPKAISIVAEAGIAIPTMYRLGFNNNNCIGCVKGGMAYWNLIRKHFPDHFAKMSALEDSIGRTCLKKYALKDLPLDAGRGTPPLVDECGATGEGCVTELSRKYYGRE